MEDNKGGQWAILPAAVRYDRGLPANAKLLYAEIAAKINEEGYCFCSNRFFAERMGLKEDTVSSLFRRLQDGEYIRIDLDLERGNRDKRRVYLTGKPYDFTGGIGFKSGTGKISDTVSDKNPIPIENNNLKSIPPKAPQGGQGVESLSQQGCCPDDRKASQGGQRGDHVVQRGCTDATASGQGRQRAGREKKQAGWQPERFEMFWAAYPRGEAKEKARRAWDRLKPDEGTMRRMALALKRQLQCEDWQRGIGIPYAATWLNQRRWEDERRAALPQSRPDGGWAETGEVF